MHASNVVDLNARRARAPQAAQPRQHWTTEDWRTFDMLRECDGRSEAYAAAVVDHGIRSRSVPDSDGDRLLRQAREAFALLGNLPR